MENCHLSSGNTNNNYSPISSRKMENQLFYVPDENKCIFLNQNDGENRLSDIDKEIQWFWGPRAFFQSTAPISSQLQRQNIKREVHTSETVINNEKSIHFDLHDALRQTKVPSVPEPTTAGSVINHIVAEPITPTIEYFSNDIFFYNNGVFQRPTIHTVTALPRIITRNQDLLSESDDDDSEIDSVYSSIENEELRERGNVRSQVLKDYSCPICFECPTSPVSTICGHVFCEKCVNRIFRLKMSKWKCPQCRRHICPSDYHPIYLP